MITSIFIYIVLICLCVIATIVVINFFTFPRLRQFKVSEIDTITIDGLPEINEKISILIPVRNEEKQIALSLNKFIKQQPPLAEIIILDDQSTDHTLEILNEVARQHDFIKIVTGRELPIGWTGKNWASQQLSDVANGDILIFTDADVLWEPSAVTTVVQAVLQLNADLLSVWPTQILETLAERLIVPMMSFSVLAYLPYPAVSRISLPIFSAANGQCLVFKRKVYSQIGGHAAVRSSIIEDVSMAKKVKSFGLNLSLADGDNLIKCRMYTGWTSVLHGYAKNILAGHGNRPSLLIVSTLFHWLLFVFPWFWLFLGWLSPSWPNGFLNLWPLLPMVMIALGIFTRMLSATIAHQPVKDAIFLPVSVFLMTLIAAQSLWWHFRYGGPIWKGRIHLATPKRNHTT